MRPLAEAFEARPEPGARGRGTRPGSWVLRIVTAERLVRGLVLLGVGLLYLLLGPATGDGFGWELYRKGVRVSTLDLHRSVVQRFLVSATGGRFDPLTAAIGFGVGALTLGEGAGLALRRTWAERLTLAAAVAFSVVGVVAVADEPTPWRWWGLGGNLFLVGFFGWRELRAGRGAR